jgi:hypothetical protein
MSFLVICVWGGGLWTKSFRKNKVIHKEKMKYVKSGKEARQKTKTRNIKRDICRSAEMRMW